MYLSYTLYVIIILLGFIFNKSKIMSVFILLSMWFFATFKDQCFDLIYYELGYNQSEVSSRYLGFTVIQNIFKFCGLNFIEFSSILYIICYVVMLFAIKKLTCKPNYVLSIYLLTAYSQDVIQIKQLVANTIVLWAIVYCIISFDFHQYSNKKTIIKLVTFSILIICASTIHISTLFWLPVGFIVVYLYKKPNVSIKILFLILLLTLALNFGLMNLVIQFQSNINATNIEYFNEFVGWKTNLGWIIYLLYILLVVYVAFMLSKNRKNQYPSIEYLFIYVSATIIPLILNNGIYFRVYRIIVIILSSLFVSDFKLKTNEAVLVKNIIILIAYVAFVILSFILFTLTFYEGTLGSLMSHNFVLNNL